MWPTHILLIFLLDSVELKFLGRKGVLGGEKFWGSLPGIHFKRALFFLEDRAP